MTQILPKIKAPNITPSIPKLRNQPVLHDESNNPALPKREPTAHSQLPPPEAVAC